MVVLESRDNRKLLIDLIEKKFLGAERLLMCPLNSPARRQYLNWITEILKRQIASSQSPNQHRFSLYSCLMSEAPGIRERMNHDPEFCGEFSSTLWKRFVGLAGPDRWDVYAGMPGLWTLLRDPRGVDLIKKYLHLPFVLYEKYSKAEEWAVVRQTLLNGDDALLTSAIFLCRDDELFHEFLLRKDITGKTRRNILAALVFGKQPKSSGSERSSVVSDMESKAEADRRHELLCYVRDIKSAEAVDKEFGARRETAIPVIGNIVILGEKGPTGRKRSWSDWGAAGMDAVCIALAFVSPPGTSETAAVAIDIGKNVADQARDALGEYAKTQFLAELHDSILANRNHRGLTIEEKVRLPYFLSITLWKAKLPTLRNSPPQVVRFMPLVKLLIEQSKVGADSMRLLADWEVSFTLREGGYLFVSAGDKYRQGLPAGLSESLSASAVEETAVRERDPEKLHRAWQINAYAWWSAFLKYKYR